MGIEFHCPLTVDQLASAAAVADRRKQMRRQRLIDDLNGAIELCHERLDALAKSSLPLDVIIERSGDFLARLAIARKLMDQIDPPASPNTELVF